MIELSTLTERYEVFRKQGLKLDMTRGQPSDENFDLSNSMMTIVDENDVVTPSGVAVRNYGGGINGLAEVRELCASILRVRPEETLVGNNASLELMSHVLTWALLRGLKDSPKPWSKGHPKMIVTVPGYDRHFHLLDTLGYEMVPVGIDENGPDMDAVEQQAMSDPDIKGIYFVPTYSNPTGGTISDENVKRLASLNAAASDFTIFADDAYTIHHLTDQPSVPLNFLEACKATGNPDRVYIFGSTSKVTLAGAGLGFMATSEANLAYIGKLLSAQTIGPNKIEQYRHVKFLNQYEGGLFGLMCDHANILKPKFDAVQRVLSEELGDQDLATWADPKGGYFINLDTKHPVADRVVALAKDVGVALTPAGATYPFGKDPNNSNIRIAPTRPPLAEVEEAMKVLALCIQLASAEYLNG